MKEPESYRRAFNRLCHVLPLTKSGKVQEVVDSLVLKCFGVDTTLPLGSPASVADALDTYFEIDVADVQRSIDRHQNGGRLLPGAERGLLALDPATRAEAGALLHTLDEICGGYLR
jgi:hypothetical protein